MKKNEFELINLIKSISDNKIKKPYAFGSSIGDDCAIISNIKKSEDLLVTTDILVEDIHFDLSYYTMYELGYKSAIVNISDIISKGGKPFAMFISIAIPKKINETNISDWYEGFIDACKPFDASISGGDTTSSKDKFFISITAIGKIEKGKSFLRNRAKNGDNIYVLGRLGESAIGLSKLQNGIIDKNDATITAHLTPKLFYEEIQTLSKQYQINASIDISDGLIQDLSHIAKASNVICKIQKNADFSKVNSVYKNTKDENTREDLLKYILSGGEDYAIAFTSPDVIPEAENIICVGNICSPNKNENASTLLYDANNNICEIMYKGYMHF